MATKTLKVLSLPQILKGKRVAIRRDLVFQIANALTSSSLIYQDEWTDLLTKEVRAAESDWDDFLEWIGVPKDNDPIYNIAFDTGLITYEESDDISHHSQPDDADDPKAPVDLQQHRIDSESGVPS